MKCVKVNVLTNDNSEEHSYNFHQDWEWHLCCMLLLRLFYGYPCCQHSLSLLFQINTRINSTPTPEIVTLLLLTSGNNCLLCKDSDQLPNHVNDICRRVSTPSSKWHPIRDWFQSKFSLQSVYVADGRKYNDWNIKAARFLIFNIQFNKSMLLTDINFLMHFQVFPGELHYWMLTFLWLISSIRQMWYPIHVYSKQASLNGDINSQ